MSKSMGIIKQSLTIIIASLLLVSGVFAQANSEETERDRRDKQQTKKSQAVSKSVYEKITRAQEAMEAEDNDTALALIEAAELIMPQNSLTTCVDHSGVYYRVPIACINDPIRYDANESLKNMKEKKKP